MAPKHRLSHLFPQRRGKPINIPTRDPVPLDSTKPSVAQLPDVVIQRILASIQIEDLSTVASLSSSLYRHARYAQHCHVRVDLDKPTHVLHRLHLIKRLGQLGAICTLQVHARRYDDGQKEIQDILACLADMLPAMTSMRHVHWHVGCYWEGPKRSDRKRATVVPIPAPILTALPTGSHLHTSFFCDDRTESHVQARPFLHGLAENQHLRTLSVRVTFVEQEDCAETMRALKKVLLSCPNLTRIPMIDVWYPRGARESHNPPEKYPGLGLVDGERPPALKELGMRDYPWGNRWQGYPAKGNELEYWVDTFNWSQLVRLNDVPDFLASAIAPKLTSLRELIVAGEVSGPEPDFFQALSSPLETISLPVWDLISSKPELIGKFGATLRQLKIQEQEPEFGSRQVTFVSAPDLIHLSKSLVNLEHLALDITRDQDAQKWPYALLDAIAAFPRLRTVELWFPLGSAAPAPAPHLTKSSAELLFHYLRERNSKIQRVTIHSGAPTPKGPISLRNNSEPSWAVHNSISFVCEIVYHGEGPEERGGGWLSISCPELSASMNAQLHQLTQQADRKPLDPINLDADGLLLRAALDGPIDGAGWWNWMYKRKEKSTALQKLVTGPLKRVLIR